MGEEMREAAYSLAKVTYVSDTGTNYQSQIMQAVKLPAVTLKVTTENVAGVRLPVFQINMDNTADSKYPNYPNQQIIELSDPWE